MADLVPINHSKTLAALSCELPWILNPRTALLDDSRRSSSSSLMRDFLILPYMRTDTLYKHPIVNQEFLHTFEYAFETSI
jgi:hypothetical protein